MFRFNRYDNDKINEMLEDKEHSIAKGLFRISLIGFAFGILFGYCLFKVIG